MASSFSEPRSETTPEPGSKSEPEPESEPLSERPNAEPVPEWPAAHDVWGGAWEVHWIGLGVLFFCVALWSLAALVQVRKRKLLATRRFCYAVNTLLVIFGTTRGLALFLYPYEMVANARGTPVALQRALFGIGFPCLTAGFTLIHFAFLEAAKFSHSHRRIQSLRFIVGLIVLHFALEAIAEFTTSYVAKTGALLIVCLIYFVVFALVLSLCVLYSGLKVINRSKSTRRTLKRLSLRDGNSVKSTKKVKNTDQFCNKESSTTKVAYVTVISSFLGLACAATQIYAIVCVFRVTVNTSGDNVPKAWPWWSYQTVSRVIELCLACTMAYTISHPKKGGYKMCLSNFRRHKHSLDQLDRSIVLTNSSGAQSGAVVITRNTSAHAQHNTTLPNNTEVTSGNTDDNHLVQS